MEHEFLLSGNGVLRFLFAKALEPYQEVGEYVEGFLNSLRCNVFEIKGEKSARGE